MNKYPRWSGIHPDLIIIKTAPDIVDVSGITGSRLDRRKTPMLEIAVEMYGCKLEPTDEFEVDTNGEVAQIWLISKIN